MKVCKLAVYVLRKCALSLGIATVRVGWLLLITGCGCLPGLLETGARGDYDTRLEALQKSFELAGEGYATFTGVCLDSGLLMLVEGQHMILVTYFDPDSRMPVGYSVAGSGGGIICPPWVLCNDWSELEDVREIVRTPR
ncbi:MAG: hypothetical protein V3W34_14460 [Phycisphaerae bacterium]